MPLPQHNATPTAVGSCLSGHALDRAPVQIYWTDCDGRIVYANDLACAKLEYTRDEILALSIGDLDPAYAREGWQRHWDELLRCGRLTFEARQHSRSGRQRDVAVDVSLIAAGEELFSCAYVQEVSPYRDQARGLEEREAWLQAAQRAARLGCYHFDVQRDSWSSSGTLDEIFGIDADYPRTLQGWLALVHPDDRQSLADYYQSLLARKETTFDREYRILRPADGQVRWMHGRGSFHGADAGTPHALIGVISDITEQHAARSELQKSRDQFETLARLGLMGERSIPEICDFALEEAVRLSDSQLGYIYFYSESTRLFTLYSWSQSVLPLCSIPNPESTYELDKTGIWGETVRQRREIVVNDFHAPHPLKRGYPEGHAPLARFMTLPVFDGGEIVAVVGVANKGEPYVAADVARLRLFMDGVWQLVTRKRMEESLRTARDAAESANRAKSEFLATMSHEIRTPLNGVFGMAELLRLTPLDAEQQEYLSILDNCSRSLLALLDDLLDLARIEAGRIEVGCDDFSLHDCLLSVIESQRQAIAAKGLHLSLDEDDRIPATLIGDANRLRQIVLNLLGNAIKFTEAGEVAIRSELLSREDGVARIRIAVSDTGIGIAPELQQKIFAPFEQGDSSRTRRYGGSGLGLAICKRLCEVLDGRIEVTSTPGLGSVFAVEIPFRINDPQAPAILPLPPSGPLACTLRPLKILVAEDNEINLKYLCLLLERLGHRTVPAVNGREALERWRQEEFDVLILDVEMPEFDGVETLQEIRRTSGGRRARQPAIALTAHAMRGDRERLLVAGFDHYIAKPMKLAELSGILQLIGEEIVGQRRDGAERP